MGELTTTPLVCSLMAASKASKSIWNPSISGGMSTILAPAPLDKDLILREVGGKDDELVPRAGQAVEHTAQGGGGPHGNVELVGGIAGAEAAVEGVGEALAGLLVTPGRWCNSG